MYVHTKVYVGAYWVCACIAHMKADWLIASNIFKKTLQPWVHKKPHMYVSSNIHICVPYM